MADLWWGYWADYPKVWQNGRPYALIGDRLYTEHVVTRFLPSGRRTIANLPRAEQEGGGYSFDPKARSISPNNVEYTIENGLKQLTVHSSGELRTVHVCGDLRVVTTRDERVVITAQYAHEPD